METAYCNICGLSYISTHKPDVRLHNQVHKQWLEVTQLWGIKPEYSSKLYERSKRKYRDVFHFDKNRYPFHIQVEAAIKYLHVQWLDRGLWNSVRYNTYNKFIKKYPDIPSWIQSNYSHYCHEFSSDIKIAICRRYNIIIT